MVRKGEKLSPEAAAHLAAARTKARESLLAKGEASRATKAVARKLVEERIAKVKIMAAEEGGASLREAKPWPPAVVLCTTACGEATRHPGSAGQMSFVYPAQQLLCLNVVQVSAPAPASRPWQLAAA